MAPFILFLAGCSRTVPCTDSTQAARPDTALPSQSKPVETARNAPPVSDAPAPSRPAAVKPKRLREASPEREPIVSAGRDPIGEADRMMEPRRLNVEIPSGTEIEVRVLRPLDSRTFRAGDPFSAVLVRAVEVSGNRVLQVGTPFSGHVTGPSKAAQAKGRAMIEVKLDSFRLRSQEYRIDTNNVSRENPAHRKRNFLIQGGAAAIGAIAGTGKGENHETKNEEAEDSSAEIAPETTLTFKLKHPVEM